MSEPRRDFPVPVPVEVQPPGEPAREELAVNLSPGGVCLHAREPLREGEAVEVRLDLPPDGPRVEARGRVVWTSRHTAADDAPRFWEVGIRLEALDPEVRARIAAWASQPAHRRR